MMEYNLKMRSSKGDVMSNPLRALECVAQQVTDQIEKSRKIVNQSPSKKLVTITKSKKKERYEKPPFFMSIFGYVSYVFLFVVGYVREFLWGTGPLGRAKPITEKHRKGYAPLYANFESFYTRNVYRRLKDVFNRPIGSVPGATVNLINRESKDHFWTWSMKQDSIQSNCINLASYNYLGFAQNEGPCTDAAIAMLKAQGIGPGSSKQEMGSTLIQKKLEKTVAEFLGVDDAITLGMGFATNSLNIPVLMNKRCLVLSDEKNHASIILGIRLSGATVKVFKHNNVENMERILKKSIVYGHPKTRRPWKKIFIVVEGVYSMEGSIVRLPEIIAIKKKYKAYLYLDEAHSVGALGPNGRGVVDYFGLNPKDVDIMMGTFTKSFGSAGGYIAGSQKLINYLRVNSQSAIYPTAMSPPICEQIIASMREIISGDGMDRIQTLAKNSRYFRQRLQQMGCIVHGHDDSPVVPLMLFVPAKIPGLVNELLRRDIASIGVGFPATKMTEERARFCISASHTKEMLDKALDAIDEVSEIVKIKYSQKNKYNRAMIAY